MDKGIDGKGDDGCLGMGKVIFFLSESQFVGLKTILEDLDLG
jgi:hypothetical protein